MANAIANAKAILLVIGPSILLEPGGPPKNKEAAATHVATASKGLVSRRVFSRLFRTLAGRGSPTFVVGGG